MARPAPRRNATLFIFVTIVLDMLAFGMIAPVLPKLIAQFSGSTASAAMYIGIFGVAWAAMQFVFSPLLGMLSDRVGRRPVILLSNIAGAVDYAIMALAPNLAWLFVGRLISGAASASITTASAYIADVTEPAKRAAAYGLIGSAFGLGFILGPAIGGLLGAVNPRLTFWVAMGFGLLNFLYGLFVLPESLRVEHRTRSLDWRRANPFGSMMLLFRHAELFGLTLVNFFGYLAHEVYTTVYVLYCIAVFTWSTGQIGLTLALVGATSILTSAFLVGPIVKRLGERNTLLFGLAVAVVSFAMFASPIAWVFLGGIVIGAFALYDPPSKALMTGRVGPTEQGELQGAIGCVRGIAMMIGPGIFALVFSQFAGPLSGWHLQGAPWYLASALMLVALIIALRVTTSRDNIVLATPVNIPDLNPTE
jgi:DHA1 family tetracycline resistance protein-like MFS transporter